VFEHEGTHRFDDTFGDTGNHDRLRRTDRWQVGCVPAVDDPRVECVEVVLVDRWPSLFGECARSLVSP
jgi:hypothetical protein